jgi:hypothetical protein
MSATRLLVLTAASIALAACPGRDRDGGHGGDGDSARAAAERPRDCSALVGATVDGPTDESQGDETDCTYTLPGGVSTIGVRVQWHGGEAAWQGARIGEHLLGNEAAGAGGAKMIDSIPGLGDEAFVQSMQPPAMPDMPKLPPIPGVANGASVDLSQLVSGEAALWMKRHDAVVIVVVANQRDAKAKAIAVARAVLPRL